VTVWLLEGRRALGGCWRTLDVNDSYARCMGMAGSAFPGSKMELKAVNVPGSSRHYEVLSFEGHTQRFRISEWEVR
jgi:hypothetical protein